MGRGWPEGTWIRRGYSFSADFFLVWMSRSRSSSADADSDSSPDGGSMDSVIACFDSNEDAAVVDLSDFGEVDFLTFGDNGDFSPVFGEGIVDGVTVSSSESSLILLFFFAGSSFVSEINLSRLDEEDTFDIFFAFRFRYVCFSIRVIVDIRYY